MNNGCLVAHPPAADCESVTYAWIVQRIAESGPSPLHLLQTVKLSPIFALGILPRIRLEHNNLRRPTVKSDRVGILAQYMRA